jgi:hypothetical protein
MKLGIWVAMFLLGSAHFGWAQSKDNPESGSTEKRISESSTSYAVFGATPEQGAILRSQIELMHPDVQPLRIFFVPHWKYLDDARIFQLHVPTGYGSLMFTHLPSRTIFIDNDRYQGEKWLGHWIAHELGHLATNSSKEEDAEKAAREFRKRLEDARELSSRVKPVQLQSADEKN